MVLLAIEGPQLLLDKVVHVPVLQVVRVPLVASLKTAEVSQLVFFDEGSAHCRDGLTERFFRAVCRGTRPGGMAPYN